MERLPWVSQKLFFSFGHIFDLSKIYILNIYCRSQNTWEPEVNIYAKDKIEEFEKKFKGAKKGRGRKPKVVAEDPDYDNVSDLYRKLLFIYLFDDCVYFWDFLKLR